MAIKFSKDGEKVTAKQMANELFARLISQIHDWDNLFPEEWDRMSVKERTKVQTQIDKYEDRFLKILRREG